jgi:hypothetical protein
MNHMHSFTFRAIGNLARNPEVVDHGEDQYTRFCLISNDHYEDDDGLTANPITSVWFMAGGDIGIEIAKEARKGDQLVVEGIILRDYRVRQPGQRSDDFAFLVFGYRFGAKRGPSDAAGVTVTGQPPAPVEGPKEAVTAVL